MFVVCNGSEARLITTIWRALKDQSVAEFVNISTGVLSKEKSDQSPEAALQNFGVPFKRLIDYGTMDVTRVLKIEQPTVIVVGSDQEFLESGVYLRC